MNKQLTLRGSVAGLVRAGGRAILALVLLTIAFWRRVESFYRWSLLGAGVMVGISARGAWRQYTTSGRFNPLYAIVAIWGVSYVAYRAYRWHSWRREQAAGTFSIDRFQATPIVYIAVSLATTAIWVAILFVALLALALYRALVA
jgi:hypothetical protein